MDMPEVGIAVSSGAVGSIVTALVAWWKAISLKISGLRIMCAVSAVMRWRLSWFTAILLLLHCLKVR